MKLTEARVELTQGYFAVIDEEDLWVVMRHSWRVKIDKRTAYARSTMPRGVAPSDIFMHRLLMRAMPGEVVDHINMDGLDNRKSNLRITTHKGNTMNTPARSKHGFKGISFDRRCVSRPWQAVHKVDGRNISAGFYETPELAAMAYDRAVYELHGDVAYLNFPAALEASR